MRARRENKVQVSIPDLAVLVTNFYRAAADSDIGVQDMEKGMEEHVEALSTPTITLPGWIVENMVWAAHMRDEKNEFEDCRDRDYKTWKAALERRSNVRFHDEYHYIKDRSEV